jgi:hypothetical protein
MGLCCNVTPSVGALQSFVRRALYVGGVASWAACSFGWLGRCAPSSGSALGERKRGRVLVYGRGYGMGFIINSHLILLISV